MEKKDVLPSYTARTVWASLPADEYLRRFRDPQKFIAFCRACGRYGNCWACPPFGFDPEAYLAGYETACLFGTRIVPAAAARTGVSAAETRRRGRDMLAGVRAVLDPALLRFETRYPGGKAFFAGTCFGCPEGACTRPEGRPCVRPGQVRPSLEAFGFDIGKTASELLGIELKWSADGRLPEYFTLVSGFFLPSHHVFAGFDDGDFDGFMEGYETRDHHDDHGYDQHPADQGFQGQ